MAMPSCNRDPHFSDPSSTPSLGQPLNSPYIIKPRARHTHTVILLHDVASNGRIFSHDLLTTGKTSAGKTLDYLFPGVRWVFPSAPRRPCHALEHARIAAWFDVVNLKDPSLRQETQRKGLCTSAREMFTILGWELKLVAPDKVVLGGMGQGARARAGWNQGHDHQSAASAVAGKLSPRCCEISPISASAVST